MPPCGSPSVNKSNLRVECADLEHEKVLNTVKSDMRCQLECNVCSMWVDLGNSADVEIENDSDMLCSQVSSSDG